MGCLGKLGCRAVFQHDNNPKHTPEMIVALLRKLEVMDWLSIHQLCDSIMEEREKIPVATCAAPVNYMPKRVKAAPDNNGGHKILLLCMFTVGCTHFPAVETLMAVC